jgi:homoserine O-succinyltransferase/O-acetyltransferase
MSVILPDNYHAQKALEQRRVHCITQDEALKQDIRPLRIGILNIMPHAESYEYNILYPIGRSIIQVEPVWLRLENHSYSSSNKHHLNMLYISFKEAVAKRGLDGLILTGAPVEAISFDQVTYWDELTHIFTYAREKIASTLGLCWGGLALAGFIGIDKTVYEKKLFGVYKTRNLDRTNEVTGEMDDVFWCPQSRHSGIPDKVMELEAEKGNINLLAYSEEAGYTIFESHDRRFIMHLGHPEYKTERLTDEYYRDIKRGVKNVEKPENIDLDNPVNMWRAHCLEFFLQWIKSVYIRTPYII